MSVVTIIWSMTASASLTLGLIYLVVWSRNPRAWAHFFFAVTALATTGLAFTELWVMRSATPPELLAARTLMHVPLFVRVVAITWFVWFRLGAGRRWLAWTVCGVRTIALAGHVLWPPDISGIASVRRIEFLGEPVTVLSNLPNPMALPTQLSTILLLLFVADASITAWRRGDRRKALLVGGSVELFLLAGFGSALAIVWRSADIPMAFSMFYPFLIAVMAYDLGHDVLRASQLVDDLRISEVGLRDSEERMALAVEVADLAIWTRDLDYNNVWASERWRTMFGFAPAEPLDASAIRQRVHPEDLPALIQAQDLALAGVDRGAYQIEYRLALPDGSVRWIASHARVETDAGGRATRIRGASRDITDRKLAEQETVALREAIAHAGRVSMLGQLSAALAHEINQPLGAIKLNADAATRFLDRPVPDVHELRPILRDISAESQRAGDVIDGMRNLLKRQSLDPKPLDLAGLVREVSTLVRLDALARHVKMSIDVPDGLPLVRGDRVHLQQVLLNLLLNGMDALGETAEADRRIRISSRRVDADMVEVGVADDGPGIPADKLPLVFEPFFTTKTTGMGMGLPISRTIIQAHGGRIWAESTAGQGAAFRFTLPIAETRHQESI